MYVVLRDDADVNWCKQGGITCVLLWEILYSSPFSHCKSGKESSLGDPAGKDGLSDGKAVGDISFGVGSSCFKHYQFL